MGATIWIVWIIIGIIGGYMFGKLMRWGNSLALSLIVAIAGALLGGWIFVKFAGDADNMEVISLITSAVGCALFLWIMSLCVHHKPIDDGDE